MIMLIIYSRLHKLILWLLVILMNFNAKAYVSLIIFIVKLS